MTQRRPHQALLSPRIAANTTNSMLFAAFQAMLNVERTLHPSLNAIHRKIFATTQRLAPQLKDAGRNLSVPLLPAVAAL